MIAKRIPIKSLKKSSFAALVKYITHGQEKAERVGTITISNCHSDDADWAAMEVHATQALNTRAVSDKTYHLMISFRSGEHPSSDVLKAVEDHLCNGLGFEGHQRISAVHRDTDNLHIHVAVNKIHPTRHTLHEPYYDHKKLGELCAELERKYGFEPDNHAARKTTGQSRAEDMENAAGVESLVGWIRRQCWPQIEAAQSWEELHSLLRDHGLTIGERGNGLVIVDRSGTAVKGSSVSRQCSKSALEARLGEFRPAVDSALRNRPRSQYQKKPLPSRISTTALYAQYQAQQGHGADAKTRALKTARERKRRAIESLKRTARLKRAVIKLTKDLPAKRVLYKLVSNTLQAKIHNVHKEHSQLRQTIHRQYRRVAWNDWLQQQAKQGSTVALEVLRGRRYGADSRGDSIRANPKQGVTPGPIPGVVVDSVTKQGTVIYHVADTVIRDDGKHLNVAKGASSTGIEALLRLAIHRYGKVLTVNGSDQFKDQVVKTAGATKLHIVFEDPTLEQRRQYFSRASQLQGRGRAQ